MKLWITFDRHRIVHDFGLPPPVGAKVLIIAGHLIFGIAPLPARVRGQSSRGFSARQVWGRLLRRAVWLPFDAPFWSWGGTEND